MEISLALGGGGSKGVSHLGVIRCLEKEGIDIRAVAGTSAGGMVAALYAAGYGADEMIARFKKLSPINLFGYRPGDGPALLGIAGVVRIFDELLGERTFDDLRIPTALTAVDLDRGEEVVLKTGRVADAVRATIALPGVFPPFEGQQGLLVDGGLMNPVPVAPARDLAPHLPVVAVSLNARLGDACDSLAPPGIIGHVPVLSQITRLRVAQAFNIFVHSLEVGSNTIAELRFQIDEPDLIIRPQVAEVGLLDRVDVDEIVGRGEEAARAMLPELRRAFRLGRRLRRVWKYT